MITRFEIYHAGTWQTFCQFSYFT